MRKVLLAYSLKESRFLLVLVSWQSCLALIGTGVSEYCQYKKNGLSGVTGLKDNERCNRANVVC